VLVLILLDPDDCPEPSHALLQQVFGLTRGEARLTNQLLCGQSLQDVASATGVSIATVRSQTKSAPETRLGPRLGLCRTASLWPRTPRLLHQQERRITREPVELGDHQRGTVRRHSASASATYGQSGFIGRIISTRDTPHTSFGGCSPHVERGKWGGPSNEIDEQQSTGSPTKVCVDVVDHSNCQVTP
jgi:hypothetical protein